MRQIEEIERKRIVEFGRMIAAWSEKISDKDAFDIGSKVLQMAEMLLSDFQDGVDYRYEFDRLLSVVEQAVNSKFESKAANQVLKSAVQEYMEHSKHELVFHKPDGGKNGKNKKEQD